MVHIKIKLKIGERICTIAALCNEQDVASLQRAIRYTDEPNASAVKVDE